MDTLLSAALAKTSFGAKSFVGDFYFFFGNFVGDFSLSVKRSAVLFGVFSAREGDQSRIVEDGLVVATLFSGECPRVEAKQAKRGAG
jgi:hypothetical protein